MLALVNPAALPALRIAGMFFLVINLVAGAYIFRNRNRFFGRDPNVSDDIPAVRRPLAFACFLLGAVETAAIGRMFVAKHGGRFDANQENLALAASNLAAGLGGGFPVSGGTSQSLVNEEAGAQTPLSTPLPQYSFSWSYFSSRIS